MDVAGFQSDHRVLVPSLGVGVEHSYTKRPRVKRFNKGRICEDLDTRYRAVFGDPNALRQPKTEWEIDHDIKLFLNQMAAAIESEDGRIRDRVDRLVDQLPTQVNNAYDKALRKLQLNGFPFNPHTREHVDAVHHRQGPGDRGDQGRAPRQLSP